MCILATPDFATLIPNSGVANIHMHMAQAMVVTNAIFLEASETDGEKMMYGRWDITLTPQ